MSLFSASTGWFPTVKRGLALLCLCGLTACDRGDIKVYRVAKESPAKPTPAPGDMAQTSASAAPTLPRLSYKTPANWEEAAPGQMRYASFRVQGKDGKTADVGVFPLPGQAGSDLDNVNRWRNQVGLEPIDADQLKATTESIPVGAASAAVYDLSGENPGSGEKTRILAAILRREGVAWFFKMTGDDALVAENKPAFVEFLKSLEFKTPELPPDHPPIASGATPGLPPDHPPIGGGAVTPATAGSIQTGAKPQWELPPSWKELPGGQFLVAKFAIGDADVARLAVNVSMSAGEGGGLVGNVNRWRRQLGLQEISPEEIMKDVKTEEAPGGKVSFVELTGTAASNPGKTRLIGAVVPRQGQTWFYKLMGPEELVDQNKGAFITFVKSAKYPHAS